MKSSAHLVADAGDRLVPPSSPAPTLQTAAGWLADPTPGASSVEPQDASAARGGDRGTSSAYGPLLRLALGVRAGARSLRSATLPPRAGQGSRTTSAVRDLIAAVDHASSTRDFSSVAVAHGSKDVASLAVGLNELLRSVEEDRTEQARMVADASHELRTPLTSLRTNLELLAADVVVGRLTLDQKQAILGDVQAQLDELGSLVGDLVRFTRDGATAARGAVDLRLVVERAAERVRRRAGRRLLQLRLDPFHVVGDAAALERAVTNLLDNAVKWSPEGSVVRVRLLGGRLTVSDSGPGVPVADAPYVFDRFFRGAAGRGTHGTGLGLAIVAKTVRDHGGEVLVGRSDDGGAEFTVRLPGATNREALLALLPVGA